MHTLYKLTYSTASNCYTICCCCWIHMSIYRHTDAAAALHENWTKNIYFFSYYAAELCFGGYCGNSTTSHRHDRDTHIATADAQTPAQHLNNRQISLATMKMYHRLKVAILKIDAGKWNKTRNKYHKINIYKEMRSTIYNVLHIQKQPREYLNIKKLERVCCPRSHQYWMVLTPCGNRSMYYRLHTQHNAVTYPWYGIIFTFNL